MFAYCGNNPVRCVDRHGTVSVDAYSDAPGMEDDNPLNDVRGGGGNFDPYQAIKDGTFNGSYSSGNSSVPQKAWDVLNFIKGHNGHPPQNHKGNRPYGNDGRDNSRNLPSEGEPYREYDVNPKIPGIDRGDERIVVGADGSACYTSTHYRSFIRME